MNNTKVFNDKNLNKLNGFLDYLFKNGEKYVISVKIEKQETIFVVRW